MGVVLSSQRVRIQSMASPDRVSRGFWAKLADNPWVPLGALATGAVLSSGMYAFYKGKVGMSQSMMRLRVVAQGLTVAALMLGSMRAGVDFTKKQDAKLLQIATNQAPARHQ